MILVSLVVALCNTQSGPEYCVEEIVAQLPKRTCEIQAQMVIAPWLASGKYRLNWRVSGFKCEDSSYVVRGRV